MSSVKQLIDWTERTKEYFHFDPVDNTETYQTVEDVEPLIETAKDMSSLQPGKEWRHAAVIPDFIMDKSLRERWDRKDWKKWANDPANKPFRTWPGIL